METSFNEITVSQKLIQREIFQANLILYLKMGGLITS